MPPPFTIYFAGELFDHKDLIGNALLAAAIDRQSTGRYRCVLPQSVEAISHRGADIRNKDLKLLIECDLALFNFDGLELDAGTVAEYMFAKSLDIPAVILRTDFRASGDQPDGDNWNLMCSFYPRTEIVRINALAWYRQATASGEEVVTLLPRIYDNLATTIIAGLDQVRQTPPLSSGDPARIEARYHWAIRYAGGGLADLCAEPDFVARVVAGKLAKGLV